MTKLCEICGEPAHGHHFGAITCRACAAFFKRALLAKRYRKTCKYKKECIDFSGDRKPSCKPCRLKKCIRMGMNSTNLQALPSSKILKTPSPHFPSTSSVSFISKTSGKRSFVNVNSLVSRANDLLNFGSPFPLSQKLTNLQKMSLANFSEPGIREKITLISVDRVSKFWEYDFISTARWLTHFDEFSRLPRGMKMQLLQSVWHVWARLNKIIKSAELRQDYGLNSRKWQICDKYFVEFDDIIVDTTWISKYPIEQIRCFMDVSDSSTKLEPFIQKVADLNLTKTETSYMAAQLCFQYAQNRFVGTELAEICENLLETLSNDLHSYYMESFGDVKNYAGRLHQMLRINRRIQASIRVLRGKMLIPLIFLSPISLILKCLWILVVE
ncbi:unnamed protein product [Caenorhabditis brenneri]